MEVYETQAILGEYLVFHYGAEEEILPFDFGPKTALDFPVRCVRNLIAPANAAGGGQAVDLAYDLGCAVGRSTFELGHYAKLVKGYDLSSRFIGAANALLEDGRLETEIAVEGDIVEGVKIWGPDIPDQTSLAFEVGDAVTLAADLPPADIVLAANLVCRLPTPERFLRSMARLVKPGGQLLLVTPFTWLDSFTPRSAWPQDDAGDPIRGADWIERILGEDFILEYAEDMPFLIREHARKFQWTVSYGMRWRRAAVV